MNILDYLHEYAIQYPRQVIWEDEDRTYSLSDMEIASGKIYQYLKSLGIGKEDIVAIRLPRSGKIPLVMLGVWKSGAAFVTIGEHSPENLVSYQLSETAPKLIFDLYHFEKALSGTYLEGYEKRDEHNLACVVYSTGSSGRFKGSMHEYGALQKTVDRTFTLWNFYEFNTMELSEYRSIFSAGFYSLSAIFSLMDTILLRYYLYILPYRKIGNLKEIGKILFDKRINQYFATPKDLSVIKALQSPFLKELAVSMDMFSSFYDPEQPVYNYYGMTESIGVLTCFKVDRSYEITPVGKPFYDIPMKIEGRNGDEVAAGEIGEICFVPEFFRGYIKQPEKTQEVFYDGWFHTGDMGFFNEDGNLVILGRKIDIIETSTGYIVPILISTAFNRLFPDTKKSHVQLFRKGDRPTICLYYCGDKEYRLSEIREKLKGQVPDDSLPTHSRRLEDFEYYPSGKLNRHAFLNLEEA